MKRRTTTNLKTKNTQNCRKIKLYQSLTTKDLKKKHSSRLVGRAGRTWSKVMDWAGEVVAGGVGSPTFVCRKTGRNNWGATQTTQPRVPVQRNKASKPLTEKIRGCCSSGRNSQPHRRVHWRDPQAPRTYTKPPTRESAQEGPNLLVGSGGND